MTENETLGNEFNVQIAAENQKEYMLIVNHHKIEILEIIEVKNQDDDRQLSTVFTCKSLTGDIITFFNTINEENPEIRTIARSHSLSFLEKQKEKLNKINNHKP